MTWGGGVSAFSLNVIIEQTDTAFLYMYSCYFFLCTGCPSGWDAYNGNCYFVSRLLNGRVDQASARARCKTWGADLVSIADQDEMDFVLSISYVNVCKS